MVRDVFGNPKTLLDSDYNPEVLFRRRKTEGKKIPKISLLSQMENFQSEQQPARFNRFAGSFLILELSQNFVAVFSD